MIEFDWQDVTWSKSEGDLSLTITLGDLELDDDEQQKLCAAVAETLNSFVRPPIVETALAAHRAAADAELAGWRPIESAPKDGTWIILHLPGAPDPVQPAFWDAKYFGHDFGWVQYAHRSEYEEVEGIPEHWQPLPAPPKEERT